MGLGIRNTKLVAVLILMISSGCSLAGFGADSDQSLKLADYNPEVNSQQPEVQEVDRKVFKDALASTASSPRVRLVQLLYRQGESKPYPEYRIFGITKGSPYEMLGLMDADVVVSANGFILPTASRFTKFVQLLGNAKNATIHFRRAGRPMVYKYKFE